MKKVGVTISQTLSKVVKVNIAEDDNETLKELFEREHWDLKSLLAVLKKYVLLDLDKHITDRSTRQLEVLLLSCDSWVEDDYEVIKN